MARSAGGLSRSCDCCIHLQQHCAEGLVRTRVHMLAVAAAAAAVADATNAAAAAAIR
jgi:hypothetical protein